MSVNVKLILQCFEDLIQMVHKVIVGVSKLKSEFFTDIYAFPHITITMSTVQQSAAKTQYVYITCRVVKVHLYNSLSSFSQHFIKTNSPTGNT